MLQINNFRFYSGIPMTDPGFDEGVTFSTVTVGGGG